MMVLAARERPSAPVVERMTACADHCADLDRFLYLCKLQKVSILALGSLRALDLSECGFIARAVDALESHPGRQWGRYRKRLLWTVAMTRDALTRADVRFCFVRGTPFADRFYERPLLRMSGDIDILVEPGNGHAAVEALEETGFVQGPCVLENEAVRDYIGQTELKHSSLRICVDVNHFLTGGGAIHKGKGDLVEAEEMWTRASHAEGAEWRLADEDVFLNHVRHVGQGHHFDTGLLLACADMAAFVRTCADRVDWDFVCAQTRRWECARVLRFFAWFYDRYYRDETQPPLGPLVRGVASVASDRECGAFSRTVLLKFLAPKLPRETLPGAILDGNRVFLCKFWTLDRMGRLLSFLTRILWPSRHEVVLMTRPSRSESIAARRLRYYLNPLALAITGALVGVAVRCAVAAIRLALKPWHRADRPAKTDGSVEENE
ncbi:MAG: nucleotidyltransferase family protein [bacterium]|nr:nucleotidyltransferase family protein [bacterium]